jgi:adenosylcobinamide kinase/adenosylcobinamide-phosphate guanylyltransferase
MGNGKNHGYGHRQELGDVTLILGGARSGKSRLGETIISGNGQSAIYIATAQAHDDEMRQRIALHQSRRGDNWRTVESPLELSLELSRLLPEGLPVLVDCLTLWLSNIMLADRDIEAEVDNLSNCVGEVPATLVLVSNETGLGIVPDNALARRFRDASGLMNQKIAAAADNVLFVAAGLPLVMKGRNPALSTV